MRAVSLLAAVCTLAHAEDAREIVRRSVQLMDRNLVVARNYTFLERLETHELDASGHVQSRKILLYDVTLLEGSPYRRLVGRDDHPLAPDEQLQEQKKLDNSIAQRRKETPAERERRIAGWERKRQLQREPLREVPDAFDFQVAGEERIEGRDAWVIAASPRAGYHARSSIARLFPKLRGKIWIDKADYQWVRTEAEVTDNISWGLVVARLSKGARLKVQMTRVNDEVWLPKRIEAHGSARIALLKKYRLEAQTSFSDYHKFQAESRLVPVAVPPQ
jgi:hypothetical protein